MRTFKDVYWYIPNKIDYLRIILIIMASSIAFHDSYMTQLLNIDNWHYVFCRIPYFWIVLTRSN